MNLLQEINERVLFANSVSEDAIGSDVSEINTTFEDYFQDLLGDYGLNEVEDFSDEDMISYDLTFNDDTVLTFSLYRNENNELEVAIDTDDESFYSAVDEDVYEGEDIIFDNLPENFIIDVVSNNVENTTQFEAFRTIVRHGKVIKKQIRRKRRMSAKQKMALLKARKAAKRMTRAERMAAVKKRRKSMMLRKRKGLD